MFAAIIGFFHGKFFRGPHVEAAGLVLAAASAALLLVGGARIGVLIALSVYLIDRFLPEAFAWLANFAEPNAWPGYVALGVAALFAAHSGGLHAVLVVAGIFMTGDGRLFDELY